MTASPQPLRDGIFQDATDLAAMAEAGPVGRLSGPPASGPANRVRLYQRTSDQDRNPARHRDDRSRSQQGRNHRAGDGHLPDGRIAGVSDTFSAFNEPSIAIPPEITAITGITDDMVAGHRIDQADVNAFVDDAVIVIAHNAGFDRKFSERYWPVFERKAWGCSTTEVDWRKHGFEGSRLGYLLNGAGFFHQAHRAIDDCHALLEILALELPTTGAPALALLLETARRKAVRVWAEQSPFDLKDSLKRRGYRWSDGSDGRPRSWCVDLCETAVDDEIAFLKAEIYQRDVEPRLETLTAFTRFSGRI